MLNEKDYAFRSLIASSEGVHLTTYLVNRGDSEELRMQLNSALVTASKYIQPVMSRSERTQFLKPIRALLDNMNILQAVKGNIGIFRTLRSFRVLHLPVEVEPTCMVANSFHVKPLLRWLQTERKFLLVGIENCAVHLYRGSQDSLQRIDSLKFTNGLRSGFVFWNRRKREQQKIIEVVQWLEERLPAQSKSTKPKLFFAGRRKIADAIKNELSYENISKGPSLKKFSTKALSKVYDYVGLENSQEAARHLELASLEFKYAHKMDLTEANIFAIAKDAVRGRIRKLMIADNVKIFGKLNRTTGDLVIHRTDLDHEDDDVLDDIAQVVLAKGGSVVVSTAEQGVPGNSSILAIPNPMDPDLSKSRGMSPLLRSRWLSETNSRLGMEPNLEEKR